MTCTRFPSGFSSTTVCEIPLFNKFPRSYHRWTVMPESAESTLISTAIDTFLHHRRRVEDWRVGVGRILYSPLARPFVCECHNISTMSRFQPPPRQTQHAVFPHYAYLYASHQGLCGLSCWNCFRQRWFRSADTVIIEKSQFLIYPLVTPPLPAEAFTLP